MPIMLPRGRRVHPIVRSSLRRDVDCIDLVVDVADITLDVDVTDEDISVEVKDC